MNDEHFDKLLRSALMDATMSDYEDIMAESVETPPSFSKAYRRKRKALRRDPFKKKKPCSIYKRVAAAVFIITLTATSFIFSPSIDADADSINYVITEYDDHTEIEFNEICREIPVIDNWYPEYVPEGFELVEHEVYEHDVYMKWVNGDTRLFFSADSVNGGISMNIDNEHCTVRWITINGQDAMLRLSNEPGRTNMIIWQTADKETVFKISSVIDYRELIKIAKSVTVMEEE